MAKLAVCILSQFGVSGELWQLITAIQDEADALTLCEQHS